MLLLCVIYIAFIGLGLPDSLLGSAWPAIHLDFGIPVSYANFISMLSSLCTITASLNSARVIKRFGIGGVIASNTALTVVSLLGYALSPGFWWLFVLTIPMGLGAGAIDTGLNNFAKLARRERNYPHLPPQRVEAMAEEAIAPLIDELMQGPMGDGDRSLARFDAARSAIEKLFPNQI